MTPREIIDWTLQKSGSGTLEELEARAGSTASPPFDEAHYLDGFRYPDGKFRFKPDWTNVPAPRANAFSFDRDMPGLPDHWDVIEKADAKHPFRLATSPAREYLNSSFNEMPTSRAKHGPPRVKVHPEDLAKLGVANGGRVRMGNERGEITLAAEAFPGVQPGVVIVESIAPNDQFEGGEGINTLTSAYQPAPYGGAAVPRQPCVAAGSLMSGSTSATPDETYQHGHHASVVSNHAKRTAEDCAGFFLPVLKPGMRLLDVGCGPGSITVGLARRVAPAETIGIDMSESVIETARSLADGKAAQKITFEVGNIYRPRFAPQSFDAIFAHQVLQHLRQPIEAIGQMRELLAPGGVLGVREVDWGSTTFYPENQGMRRFLDALLRTRQSQRRRAQCRTLHAPMVPGSGLCRDDRLDLDDVLRGPGRNPRVGRHICRANTAVQHCRQGHRVRPCKSRRLGRHGGCLAGVGPRPRRALLPFPRRGGGIQAMS